jgi:Fur family ferric uptake transcriptional regulator
MVSEKGIVRQLSQAGYRVTQPRRAVIRALLDDSRYSSPAEVHERAKRYYPAVGLVTVYRTLDLLSELGFVRRIHAEDGCHGYVVSNHGHHHHLICRQCGAALEFEGCDLFPFLSRVSQETGYVIEEHLLELVGVCEACQ